MGCPHCPWIKGEAKEVAPGDWDQAEFSRRGKNLEKALDEDLVDSDIIAATFSFFAPTEIWSKLDAYVSKEIIKF